MKPSNRSGWSVLCEGEFQECKDASFGHQCIYRKAVSLADYHAHHWCLAHEVTVPDGYCVVGFGTPVKDDIVLTLTGGTMEIGNLDSCPPCPILRRKA